MTTIHTAHGVGEIIDTMRERGGRVSYLVRIGLDERWVDSNETRVASDEGAQDLFSYQYTPDKFLNPMAGMYGAETPEKDFIARNVYAMPQEATKGFTPMEPTREVRDIERPYPYDPTPQWPVDMFPDSTIQPGEQEIDPAKRLKPSDPSTQPPSPGPSPKLFATGAYSVLRERPEYVLGAADDGWEEHLGAGRMYAPPKSVPTEESSSPGPDDREYPGQRRDPAKNAPKLRIQDNPVYPFDKVSPSGQTTHEMGEGDKPDWYSCPDCGAWHNPFRHVHDKRRARPPSSDDTYQPAYRGASLRCANCVEGGQHDFSDRIMHDQENYNRPGAALPELEHSPEGWGLGPTMKKDVSREPAEGRHRAAGLHEAEGRHRAPPNEDPFVDTLDRGALPQLVHDPGDDEHVFMKRTPFPKSRGEHFKPTLLHPRAASVFDLDFPTDMPERFAYIPGPQDYADHTQTALAAIERQAAIMEGEYGLSPRVGMEMDLVQANPDIREAAWRDVQRKAKRLRSEGRVNVKEASPEAIYASVDGDNGTYDVIIVRGNVFDLGGQSVTSWHCGCDWGQWAFKRRLTYVGRFCSHAYATYQEMRAMHDTPGKGTRTSGVVEDFKSWAKDNQQPTDIDGITSFLSRSTGEDDPTDYTSDEVASLYDYAEDHLKETPEREYDIPYTFDNEKAYKTSRDMLRTTPRSLTPDLQFVPEGEDETWSISSRTSARRPGPGRSFTVQPGRRARGRRRA